jgi:hypothetical protein
MHSKMYTVMRSKADAEFQAKEIAGFNEKCGVQ